MLVVVLSYVKELYLVWFILALVGCISAYWLLSERFKLKSYAADILIRKECKEQRKPLGTLVNKSGTKFEFVIEPNPEKPGMIKYEAHTLRNPTLASSELRGYLPNGIPYVDYFVNVDFPVSHRTTAALTQLLEHVRDTRPELSFMGEHYIIEGVFKESKYAYDDCVQVVKKYLDAGVEMPEELFYAGMKIPTDEEDYLDYDDETEEAEYTEEEETTGDDEVCTKK